MSKIAEFQQLRLAERRRLTYDPAHTKRMRRVPGFLALVGLVLLVAARERGTAAPATPPTPAAAPNAQMVVRAWWNQPDLVAALKLTNEQRTKMNALLTHSFESQRAAQLQQGQHQKDYEQALAKGDWQTARQQAAAIREGLVATWAAQSTLKIDVLALLTPEQRQIVATQYPLLLRQPSVFGVPQRPASVTPHG